MKQILQSFKTGKTELAEIPAPQVKKGTVLIQTTRSLVSLGTERMLVEFGKANLLEKARQQPDKVKMVLDKVRAEGLLPTMETVFNKLEQPLPLGYCNVGKVIEVGEGVETVNVGDRVVSNGPHAEIVNVPENLVAVVPENVSDEQAAFTVIGSIGLQGIRLCQPTFGETIVVVGLGLIGLLTAQMLMANGCTVIGIDIDQKKCDLAQKWGVSVINPTEGQDPVKTVLSKTQEVGADGVIITASAKNNDIVSQAAQMSRKRGRIILVGVIGLNLSRAEFYEKELTFQVSCSYGPGRYDDDYEQKGIDYPLAFVRWTEKRNFSSILEAISTGKISLKELITETIELKNFAQIYDNIGKSNSIASILSYPEKQRSISASVVLSNSSFKESDGVLGIIGAGNFTKMTLLPALKDTISKVKYIASSGGVNGTALAQKHNIPISTTDYNAILKDPEVKAVMITTRHNSHSKMVVEGLQAKKNVFVEKPLALNQKELDAIISSKPDGLTVTVGFNRRFSPHIMAIKESLGKVTEPINMNLTMNAGHIPSNVWVHDLKIGGGRIIGEACHYIDLCVYMANSMVSAVCMSAMGINPEQSTDNASILLKFENGSQAVVNYFSNGSKAYSKERMEVYSQEKTWVMDNFRSTKAYGVKGFKSLKTKINKGHKNQFEAFQNKLEKGGGELIPFAETVNVTKASFAALESLKTGGWVKL